MVATLRDVAEAAGVHPGTVSRALNNPVEVSAKTVARVRKAAAKLGYVPNPERPWTQDQPIEPAGRGGTGPDEPAVPADHPWD